MRGWEHGPHSPAPPAPTPRRELSTAAPRTAPTACPRRSIFQVQGKGLGLPSPEPSRKAPPPAPPSPSPFPILPSPLANQSRVRMHSWHTPLLPITPFGGPQRHTCKPHTVIQPDTPRGQTRFALCKGWGDTHHITPKQAMEPQSTHARTPHASHDTGGCVHQTLMYITPQTHAQHKNTSALTCTENLRQH